MDTLLTRNAPIVKVKQYYTSMSFGKWLHNARTAKGLSLRDLERRINKVCTFGYLNQLEKGLRGKKGQEYRPDLEIVDALARALDADPDEARLAAGYAPKSAGKPQNIQELLTALNRLGVEFNAYTGTENLSEEAYEGLLKDLSMLIEVTIMRMARDEGITIMPSNPKTAIREPNDTD